MSGKGKTIYIRQSQMWIFRALEEVKKGAAELGVTLSDSDIIMDCVVGELEPYKNSPKVTKSRRVRAAVGRYKRSIRCPNRYKWVFDRIEALVSIKKELGFETSFSNELLALAANGLQADNKYGTIVKQLLEDAHRKAKPK